ncbi:MAG: hypothetical protein ACSLEN_12550 [Candidatus Malihini olakiniferum]
MSTSQLGELSRFLLEAPDACRHPGELFDIMLVLFALLLPCMLYLLCVAIAK